jgi:hypothetical protein
LKLFQQVKLRLNLKAKPATTSKPGAIALLVVETNRRVLTAFYPDGDKQEYKEGTRVEDKLLPGLNLSVDSIWSEADL